MASHRRTLAAAAATILASISLYPIFTGTTWFWAGCGSVAVVALAGTATRVRRLPVIVCLLLGAAALLLYLNVTFANAASLWHLLPTPGSLASLGNTAGQGFNEASRYAPPVPGLRGMVLLGAAGIGIAGLLTDLIAVRLGRAALAGLPLLLLFTEPFTLSVQRGFIGTTLAFIASVAGYLWLLSSEARDKIREWEQPGAPARDAPDTRPLAAAGRRVGFASVALALCLPLFIPGLHMTRLFGGGHPGIGGKPGSSSGSVGFPDPNTLLTRDLHESQRSTVLSYQPGSSTTTPDYLQIYTLDRLTSDDGWKLYAQPKSLVSVSPRLPGPPGQAAPPAGQEQTEKITIASSVGQDEFGALPVPYPATTVRADGHVQADRNTLMVFDAGVTLGGLKYTVTSRPPGPTLAQLNAAPPVSPSDNASHYLTVPASYRPLTAQANTVVHAAGATTQYEDAVALQNWLSVGAFTYTLKAPTVLNAAALDNFLNVTKAGYCQQFSFAMAVLARLLGIPSRVAYGFTSGAPGASGTWTVTTADAHAWPELYFTGYGWLRFEPTPNGSSAGQATAFAPLYASPQSTQGAGGALATTPATGPSPTASVAPGSKKLLQPNQGLLPPGDQGGGTGAAAGGGGTSPWVIAGLVVAGLLVLAAATPWCVRRAVRRRRWGHRGGPASPSRAGGPGGPGGPLGRADRVQARDITWAHAAWLELRDDLLDYGAGYRPSESPRAVAARASERLSLAGPAREALGRIALAEERARYAPAPADGARLRADSVAVRRAIAAAVPRGARWRARLLPSSVLRAALSAATATGERYRALRGMSLPGDAGR